MRLRQKVALASLVGLCSTAAFGAASSGFQCDVYAGSVITDPPITRIFVKDDTTETVELADGRYLVSFDGYGQEMRMAVARNGESSPLAITAFNGTRGTIYARDAANEINVFCIRQTK